MAQGIALVKNGADVEPGFDVISGSSTPIVSPFRLLAADGKTVLWQVGPLGTTVSSSSAVAVQNVNTTPTVLTGLNELIIVDASGGNIVLTLPAAAGLTGFGGRKTIIKKDTTANTVTINRAGADTIDPNGYTTIQLLSPGSAVTLQSDGVSIWYTVPDLWNLANANFRTVATTPYSVVPSDNVLLIDATGGAATVNLPAANSVPSGWPVSVKKKDVSGNAVTVTRAGADTIEGATTAALAAQFNSVNLRSDGVGIWYKF